MASLMPLQKRKPSVFAPFEDILVISTLSFIVEQLVDFPDEVSINELSVGDAITFQISVSPDDRGKVIGKQGRIVNAIRSVVLASCPSNRQKVYIEILD